MNDVDWRTDGRASARALGWAALLFAGLFILGVVAAVVVLVAGMLRTGLDVPSALIIAALVLLVVWQAVALVREELGRHRGGDHR